MMVVQFKEMVMVLLMHLQIPRRQESVAMVRFLVCSVPLSVKNIEDFVTWPPFAQICVEYHSPITLHIYTYFIDYQVERAKRKKREAEEISQHHIGTRHN